jgi:peptidoglycan hydrolase-like protein with peptidoglycan-binding domain
MEVTRVQSVLKALGDYKGSIDGKAGTQTKDACNAYLHRTGVEFDLNKPPDLPFAEPLFWVRPHVWREPDFVPRWKGNATYCLVANDGSRGGEFKPFAGVLDVAVRLRNLGFNVSAMLWLVPTNAYVRDMLAFMLKCKKLGITYMFDAEESFFAVSSSLQHQAAFRAVDSVGAYEFTCIASRYTAPKFDSWLESPRCVATFVQAYADSRVRHDSAGGARPGYVQRYALTQLGKRDLPKTFLGVPNYGDVDFDSLRVQFETAVYARPCRVGVWAYSKQNASYFDKVLT